MAPLAIAALSEVITQLTEMIQASDGRNAPEPFLLQGEDDALGDGNGALLTNGATPVSFPTRSAGAPSTTAPQASPRALPTMHPRTRE